MQDKISVILTLYKRPYNLEKQIVAIKNQSIKYDELLLFQDKVENEKIEIPQNVISAFDNIYVSEHNVGVWGRFNFARQAKNNLIFLFDDDTIPGNLWFENCINEMNKKEALYGTNGVLMDIPKNYPFKKNFQHIGWKGPNPETVPVDFVGHCWFFKRKWLDYMFENTENMQAYKICAEDMTFSYKLQQNGICTLVPPHPLDNMQMWGNCILQDVSTHADKNGLSANNNNLKKYNLAMKELLKQDFIPLVYKYPFQVKRINLLIKLVKRITWCLNLLLKNTKKVEEIRLAYIAKVIKKYYKLY